ncbi:arsenite efflux transporter metallochaperone ArsD [Pseudalkalibacillus hwajinpoensis]|uniref:arsenite efflux transporter metallochaperone ArsD n=1 Tax=Guptibacillus hwajinpoensis TaxID=208199 RepID=UPI00325B8FEF
MKIEIYDPAMCCSTGVCGPGVDPELTRIAHYMSVLKKHDMDIQRFNLSNDTAAFVQHPVVRELLQTKGEQVLPLVLADNEIVKIGEYPNANELAEWTGLDVKLLEKDKETKNFTITLNPMD